MSLSTTLSTKACRRCMEVKSTDDFNKQSAAKDGLQSYCKDCQKINYAGYYQDNKEKISARSKRHYYANHDRMLEVSRKQYRENPEYYAAYREANRERYREYYRNNAEYMRQRAKEWYDNNLERGKQARRDYRLNNPEKVRTQENNKRAVREGAPGYFTEEEWEELCKHYGNRCLCCGTNGGLTVDHVIPVSLGGSNYIDNIQPLCLTCNMSKGIKTTDYRYNRSQNEEVAEVVRYLQGLYEERGCEQVMQTMKHLVEEKEKEE